MYYEAKLRGKIAEAGYSISMLAARIGINPTTMHNKLTGKTEFTRSEIQALVSALRLEPGDVQSIFFA